MKKPSDLHGCAARGCQTAYVAMAVTMLLALAAPPSRADDPPQGEQVAKLSAPQAVRRGNQELQKGDPTSALRSYLHANELQPDAREVAFVRGLAHYDLGEYDEARDAFLEAAGGDVDELADDARYSLATCDHAEALAAAEDPQQTLSLLEDAMRQYHDVLANRPQHEAARDANFKAASKWRQLKEMLKQQQQEQPQDCDNESDDKEKKDQDDQEKQSKNQDKENEDQEKKEQEQQQSDPSDEKKEDQQKQKSESSEQQDQQQSDASEQDQEKKEQKAAAEKEERVSREQAERKLREMMQAMRDRQKKRQRPVKKVPVKTVEKDW